MPVTTEIPTKTHTIILTIRDTLDFSMCQVSSWKSSTQDDHQRVKFVVDLAEVESIRDSGQNLLWMLKECADKEQADISIVHCSPRLREELCELGLDQYFNIYEIEN
jgi:anti-anti-sigma regulatory factor